jgi:hypothetical protein
MLMDCVSELLDDVRTTGIVIVVTAPHNEQGGSVTGKKGVNVPLPSVGIYCFTFGPTFIMNTEPLVAPE